MSIYHFWESLLWLLITPNVSIWLMSTQKCKSLNHFTNINKNQHNNNDDDDDWVETFKKISASQKNEKKLDSLLPFHLHSPSSTTTIFIFFFSLLLNGPSPPSLTRPKNWQVMPDLRSPIPQFSWRTKCFSSYHPLFQHFYKKQFWTFKLWIKDVYFTTLQHYFLTLKKWVNLQGNRFSAMPSASALKCFE